MANEVSSSAELSAAIQAAEGPIRIIGGGTRQALGNPVNAATPLSLAGMAGIAEYEPAALSLVVKAGTPLVDVQNLIAENGQMLPFEPPCYAGLLGSAGQSTMGGIAACNIAGPRRVITGAARDSMIGVRFVDGRGRELQNGGRVMKNVTGYDLVKLMAGSHGSLGVMTELSFKLLPAPETTATLVIDAADDRAGGAIMTQALRTPFGVSGAAMMGAWVYLRVEGFESSVRYRAGALRDALGSGNVEWDQSANQQIWQRVGEVRDLWDHPGDLWRVICAPTDGPKIAAALGAGDVVYDLAGGLLWLALPKGMDLPTICAGIDMRASCLRGDFPRLPPVAAPIARINAGLRAEFDPRGILNPGILG